MRRILFAITLWLLPFSAYAQGVILQAGTWTQGHTLMYVGKGSGQATVKDAGPAAGGAVGVNPAEFGITAQGTGAAPYAGQGSGPSGTILCLYDAPTNNATGYHFLCLSPNATTNTALLITGAAGGASPIGLTITQDGTSGVTCSGSPSGSFAAKNGIVTHC